MSGYLTQLKESRQNLLIFKNGNIIFSSADSGITPLLNAIDNIGIDKLKDVITADRIVGKAAALLNIYLGAKEVHAMLVSKNAMQTLLVNKVKLNFLEQTDAIKTQDGKIFCPFERLVQGISDPKEAYEKIKAKMKKV